MTHAFKWAGFVLLSFGFSVVGKMDLLGTFSF